MSSTPDLVEVTVLKETWETQTGIKFDVSEKNGSVVVSDIAKNSILWGTDLKVGHEIVSINGIPCKECSPEDCKEIVDEVEGELVIVTRQVEVATDNNDCSPEEVHGETPSSERRATSMAAPVPEIEDPDENGDPDEKSKASSKTMMAGASVAATSVANEATSAVIQAKAGSSSGPTLASPVGEETCTSTSEAVAAKSVADETTSAVIKANASSSSGPTLASPLGEETCTSTSEAERPSAYSIRPGQDVERQNTGFVSPQEEGPRYSSDDMEGDPDIPLAAEVANDGPDLRDEVHRIMVEEAVQAEEVVPVQEKDLESGPVQKRETSNKKEEATPFYKKRWVLGSVIALLLVGIAVAVAVPVTTKGSDDNNTSNIEGISLTPAPTLTPTPSPTPAPSTPAPTPSLGCNVDPNNFVCFTETSDLGVNTVYGENRTVTGTTPAASERECLEFCQDSFAARYSSNVEGDSCRCYDAVDCLLPWGDKVSTDEIAGGTVFTKEVVDTCTFDWCDLNPNNWLCFTNQRTNYTEKIAYGADQVRTRSKNADSESDCLEFCEESFAARYAPGLSDDNCACFDSVDCLLPWGDEVADLISLTDGTTFTKENIDTCAFEYCDVFPDNWFCFSIPGASLREKNVFGQNLTATTVSEEDSENDCLVFCEDYDGARYAPNAANIESCVCFDSPECLLPWGDQIDTSLIAGGTVFTKRSFGTCAFDFCDTNPNSWLCFTNQKVQFSEKTVYGENLVNTTSTNSAETERGCLEFCEESFAARYSLDADGDSCVCYDAVDCLLPWGTNISNPPSGTLFTKESIATCSSEYCDFFQNNSLCV